MIHTHNDNSVNFLSPGSGRGEVRILGDHLVVRGMKGGGGGQSSPNGVFRGCLHNSQS